MNNVIRCSNVFDRNLDAFLDPNYTIAANEGGTSSSKTYSILQLLITIALHSNKKYNITIGSESAPHLRRGCIKDFFNIIGPMYDEKNHNKSFNTYDLNGHKFEFLPIDSPDKMRGGRRDILYINECNNVLYDSYLQLEARTNVFTFLDWNPVCEFWYHEHLVDDHTVSYIHSTYQDAKDFLPEKIVQGIEKQKDTNPNWWRVYGLGLVGNIEGLVHPYFDTIEELPKGHYFYGLDWGYSNDPTALIKCIIVGDKLYCQQIVYERGLTNQDLANKMRALGVSSANMIHADSEDPKSIEEVRREGFNIVAAPKGPGSLDSGIQLVNQYKQFWTSDSVDCIKEQRNYQFITDKRTNIITNKPMDMFNHGMDARRYAVAAHRQQGKVLAAKVAF